MIIEVRYTAIVLQKNVIYPPIIMRTVSDAAAVFINKAKLKKRYP